MSSNEEFKKIADEYFEAVKAGDDLVMRIYFTKLERLLNNKELGALLETTLKLQGKKFKKIS